MGELMPLPNQSPDKEHSLSQTLVKIAAKRSDFSYVPVRGRQRAVVDHPPSPPESPFSSIAYTPNFKLHAAPLLPSRCMATLPQIYANGRNPPQSTGLPVEDKCNHVARGQTQLRTTQYSRQELASFCNFTPPNRRAGRLARAPESPPPPSPVTA